MKKYSCSILYKFNSDEFFILFGNALKVVGFEPAYMDIFFDEFSSSLDDIRYDAEYLFKLLEKKPGTVMLKNKIYDADAGTIDYCWFRFKLMLDNPYKEEFCSLEWSNLHLDFLLNSSLFNEFLSSQNIIYCYCYNQYDCIHQSNTSAVNPDFEKPWKRGESSRDFILKEAIDISEHWGRYIKSLEFTFMAAPLMWFGEEYFKIIPKESLLKFKGASIINYPFFNLVHIKLFELYDDPSKADNRKRQKDFWGTFDLQKKAEQYEKDRPFDFIAWYKERAASKKKKKIK